MSNPLLISADTHLQDGFRAPDTEFALKQILQIADTNNVSGVIFAGDVNDSPRTVPRPVNALHRFLDELYDSDVPFGYIRGQHDGAGESWAAGHRHACHLHRQTHAFGCRSVYGLDFQPAGRLQEELNVVPAGVELLIAHQTWADWMGEVTNPQGSFCDVPIVPALATGDLHMCKILKTKGKDGQSLVVGSPGATCQQAINEPSGHYVLIYERGGFKRLKLDSRQMISIGPLVKPEDLEHLMSEQLEAELGAALRASEKAGLPEELCRPYLRISYSYRLSDVVRRVEKLVNKRAILYWDEIPPDREHSEGRAVRAEAAYGGAVTPRSVLPDFVDQQKSPEVFALVSELLDRPADQDMVLHNWRAEFMTAKE